MADKVIISKSILTDIGDAIREKEGSTELIPSNELAARIRNLQTGGAIEVTELPESAEVGTFYKIGTTTAEMYYANSNGYLINMAESNSAGRWVSTEIVDGKPEKSETSRSSSTWYTLYYDPNTGKLWWNEDGLSVTEFDNWTPVVVSSEDEMTVYPNYYLLVQTVYTYYYYHEGDWYQPGQ